jgi:hypothetical protein
LFTDCLLQPHSNASKPDTNLDGEARQEAIAVQVFSLPSRSTAHGMTEANKKAWESLPKPLK